MKSIFLFVLVTLFTAIPAQAFNKEQCGKLFPKSDDTHPPYYSPLYLFTMFPSTTSYVSSIGPCSMYGGSSIGRAQFLEKSLEPLKIDVARGAGEYLNALAELSGCSISNFDAFAQTLHSRFEDIFAPGTTTELAGRIDSAAADICA